MKKESILLSLLLLHTTLSVIAMQERDIYFRSIRREPDTLHHLTQETKEVRSEVLSTIAQERRLKPLAFLFKEKTPFDFIFSGYVHNATFYDTRQNYGFADNYVLIFPKERVYSADGADINAAGQYNMLSIESRIIATIFGPKIGSAVISGGRISVDFRAIPSGTINIRPLDAFDRLTMRHAFLMLASPSYSFIAGQTWHPMTFPIVAPDTISNNGGSPFNPGSTVSQMRLTYHHKRIELVSALLSETFFSSLGPRGATSTYARNSLFPDCALHMTTFFGNHHCGIGADIRSLRPRLVTNKNIKTNTRIFSMAAIAHTSFYFPKITWHTKAVFAQNGNNLGVLGGYAVDWVDPITDQRTYTNLRSVAAWTELIINGPIKCGLFAGYLKNLGANKKIIPLMVNPTTNQPEITIYSFFANVNYAFRIAPRLRFAYKSLEIGTEIEYTATAYGTINDSGHIINTQPAVGNFRFLCNLGYYF